MTTRLILLSLVMGCRPDVGGNSELSAEHLYDGGIADRPCSVTVATRNRGSVMRTFTVLLEWDGHRTTMEESALAPGTNGLVLIAPVPSGLRYSVTVLDPTGRSERAEDIAEPSGGRRACIITATDAPKVATIECGPSQASIE